MGALLAIVLDATKALPLPAQLFSLAHVPFRVTPRDLLAALAGDETALEAHNAAILARVNETGEVFLSHTKLGPRYALRVAIGNAGTTEQTIARCWELLRAAGEAEDRGGEPSA